MMRVVDQVINLLYQNPRTVTQLKTVKPKLQEIVIPILNTLYQAGYKAIVWEGLRSIEEEQQKIDQGYSQLSDPHKCKHCTGDAVDIVDEKLLWNIPRSHPFFHLLGQEVLNHKEITWGGIWHHPERWAIYERAVTTKRDNIITWFADVAHIELNGA